MLIKLPLNLNEISFQSMKLMSLSNGAVKIGLTKAVTGNISAIRCL